MNEQRRFDVRLHPEAVKEYEKLDGSILNMVNKSIDELEFRADEIGKILRNNKDTKLAGCKERKLRDAGICSRQAIATWSGALLVDILWFLII